VEIRLFGTAGGGWIQVVPVALVVEAKGEVRPFFFQGGNQAQTVV